MISECHVDNSPSLLQEHPPKVSVTLHFNIPNYGGKTHNNVVNLIYQDDAHWKKYDTYQMDNNDNGNNLNVGLMLKCEDSITNLNDIQGKGLGWSLKKYQVDIASYY